jgi:hypothetical protein
MRRIAQRRRFRDDTITDQEVLLIRTGTHEDLFG